MSANLSKLKFMAKAREAQNRQQAEPRSSLEEARWVIIPELAEAYVEPSKKIDPLKGVCVRRSFNGFNPKVESRS